MNERDAFLKHLAANEDDATARLAFIDWLDEQGEHEEADRHRKWPAQAGKSYRWTTLPLQPMPCRFC